MLICIYLKYFKENFMKNKIINYIFLLASISISTSVFSETKLEAICAESMAEVSGLYVESTNIVKIKQQINEKYKGIRLRKFLKNQWLSEMKKGKDFTPNSFYVQKDKYTKKCVQFVRDN